MSSRNVYCRGLRLFEQFYAGHGSLRDWIELIWIGFCLGVKVGKVATEVLNGFVVWLQSRGYAPKAIKVYVWAVQSLARYHDVPDKPALR
ncbi:MAG: hypothetical protein QXY34_03690 [Candidatus Bathyarchaeia archaeon]